MDEKTIMDDSNEIWKTGMHYPNKKDQAYKSFQ